MSQRSRPSSATGLVLGGVLAVGLGAVLLLLSIRSDSQRTVVEPGFSREVTEPVSSASGPEAPRMSVVRGAEGEVPSDRRAMPAPEQGDEVEPSRGVVEFEVGELEVSVRIADGPAEGWVALQRIETNDVATPFDPSRWIQAPLEEGLARFSDLPRGVLLIGIHVGPGPPLRSSWVNSRVHGARLEFVLGSSRVFGWVRDADGAAAMGALVRVTGKQGTVVASSASDGSYDTGGILPAGRYSVQVEAHPIAGASPRRSVDLAAGSPRKVSFGPGGDLSRWTGRLLAPDGQVVTDADGLPGQVVQLVAHSGRGGVLDVQVTDGVIDQWFERGVYALRTGSGADDRPPPARAFDPRAKSPRGPELIDLSFDLARDVQLDGFVLFGQVERPQGEPRFVSVWDPRGFHEIRAAIGSDGTFRFVGLEPGAHELRWATDGVESVTIDPFGPIVVETNLTPGPANAR